ncbi:hypothetical protein [Paenibacillus sp. DCT19]|uniref:hypothetical protein n=1 Tax=Paenibacillus sp. DCT19 TaxID=2211212 RepID=UPI000FE231C5|nr:hypothetical protein [Paenibacillus sp. DCT19]
MMKVWLAIILMCCVVVGCSNAGDPISDPPDQMEKQDGSLTATRQVGNYVLQLVATPEGEQLIHFRPSIKYVGEQTEHEIFHGVALFDVDLHHEGESIFPPRSSIDLGVTTVLKANEWYTEEKELQLTQEQLRDIPMDEIQVVLEARFDSDETGFDDKKRMILQLHEIQSD